MGKRESERYRFSISATLSVEGKENQAEILNLKTRDISSKGAFLNTEKKLQPGARVQLEMVLTVK